MGAVPEVDELEGEGGGEDDEAADGEDEETAGPYAATEGLVPMLEEEIEAVIVVAAADEVEVLEAAVMLLAAMLSLLPEDKPMVLLLIMASVGLVAVLLPGIMLLLPLEDEMPMLPLALLPDDEGALPELSYAGQVLLAAIGGGRFAVSR